MPGDDTIDLLSLDDGCPHEEVVPCEDDPSMGRCVQCGDDSFPLYDEADVDAVRGIVDGVWSYLIGRLGYVPATLHPEAGVKARLFGLIAPHRLSGGFDPEG